MGHLSGVIDSEVHVQSGAFQLAPLEKSAAVPHAAVHVTAPSRLHFGMFSFGQPEVPAFGGLGAMIDTPALRLSFTPAKVFEVHGPLASRAKDFVRRICQHREMTSAPACRIDVREAPPEHCGLGVGTQLALAVTAGLVALFDWPKRQTADPLATLGRGERSWVGIYGSAHGGLICESRERADQSVSSLLHRAALPSDWRFVLVRPAGEQGLSGFGERRAFDELPPVPIETTQKLRSVVERRILPAVRGSDFDGFSTALFDYGYMAGMCFSAVQGGPFASKKLERLVETIRSLGVQGVGQSSWGPTLYALAAHQSAAERLVEQLSAATGGQALNLCIAAPNNTGATIEVE